MWTETELANNNSFEFSLNSNLIQSSDNPNVSTIAFVDSRISDPMTVMTDLQSDVKILLDPTRDGIAQITETLKHYKYLTGIDIISHGDVAEVQLGNSYLSTNTFGQYADQLQQWAVSLSPDADLLFHGCNVAAGEAGQAFIDNLSNITGADVAASTDLTGNPSQGGNWTLEYATGAIETVTPFTNSLMNSYQGLLASLFTTQTPTLTNATDGAGSNGDYELGMEFRSAKAGTINSIRYYKAPSETGTHVGKIWSSNGTLLASVTFSNETASAGWKEQSLANPLTIAANTTYVVSVNANSHYVATANGLTTTLTNGDLSAVADGSNGVFNTTPGNFPTQSWNNSNYFRDINFTAFAPVNNTPGTINLTGTATQNQVLTANVSDANGLTGVTINYQWQQSSNGTTWNNIAGATNQTLTLGQGQVGNQVRVQATYIDALGSNESLNSAVTSVVANVNDLGVMAIAGITSQGNTLTANLSDLDGLPGAITYQWKQSSDGTTWTDIASATNPSLALDSSLVGKQVQVNASYTDVLGGVENVLSSSTSAISVFLPTQSLFTTQVPVTTNATDGSGSTGDYELGMEFRSAKAGTINSIRYYKAPSETGTHVGKIWSSNGILLANVTFTNETASGWQQQTLTTPLTIAANTTYVVSVNANSHYVATANGLTTTLTNGDLSAVADGSNGVFNTTPGNFPTQSWNNSNYFRDINFTAFAPVNNTVGTVALTGTATQNQTLSASVSDANGLNGVTINYQWQQSANGSTWTNLTGATNSTLTLGQAQVGNQVRVNAIYTDALGSSENILSTPTTVIANVNDLGTVAIAGSTVVGQVLTANVTDLDGLNGVTPTYQWQQSSDGTNWTNVSGATTQTLTLDSTLVGNQLRVNTTYTDALGTAENILSNPTSGITAVAATQSLFTSQVPVTLNATDGTGSNGDYELGMEFQSAKAGTINSIRYYKAASETGTHVGRIWSSNGTLLASVTFTNETASGWQEQALATPLTIAANTKYVVSVNANQYYVATANGLASTLTNGDISAVADGSNGVFNEIPNNFPTQSWNNTNYFRDIVFTPFVTNPNNILGTVTINGTVTEDQILTAATTDANGVGSLVVYQWQESTDNGITWLNIAGATGQTLTLGDKQVAKSIRVKANYVDTLGTFETVFSTATNSVVNINDVGLSILSGSPTIIGSLIAKVFDDDGLASSTINYKWQQLLSSVWTDITGATQKTLNLGSSFLGFQVRSAVSYTDTRNTLETIFSPGTTVTEFNPIVLENQKVGTADWAISGENQATSEIVGYGDATSINKGEAINLKVSLAQAGQYQIDVYRLGYYGGTGGRLITSVTGLNGIAQAEPTFNPDTRLVEYNWNTSYTLQTGSDWTSGLYFAKLTDSTTGKQNYIQFTLRDDNRPTDIGFQDAISTAAAYNNYGGYSTYDFNSNGGERAYQVSFDRPFQYSNSAGSEQFNNTLTWEYNMTRWLESQGYDISYFTNLDVSINPLQLYSQKTFLSVGHDEYWSMEQRDNVEKARDNGINLAFFSANTGYWQVRYEASTSGQANRVMTVYKDSSGVGSNPSIDPIAQTNPIAATTLFRSTLVNRPENALQGVAYIGDWGAGNVYNGLDYVISNAADPYFANTGLQNGDRLVGLVGYEWDAVLNNGFSPAGLVVLSASPVPSGGLTPLGLLPPGTNDTISNSVRYTAASGAKVFSTGSVQWVWGLDSDRIPNSRVDVRAQQIAINVFADMGAKPQTPNANVVV